MPLSLDRVNPISRLSLSWEKRFSLPQGASLPVPPQKEGSPSPSEAPERASLERASLEGEGVCSDLEPERGREEKGERKERERGGGAHRQLVCFGRGMAAGPPGSQTDQRLWLLLWLSSVMIKFSLIIGFDNSNLRDLFVMVCVMRIPACNGLRCNLVILTHTRRLVTQY